MSREAVATALDEAAEALARAAHALRSIEPDAARASVPEAGAGVPPRPAPAPAAPPQAAPSADVCPKHGKPFTPSKNPEWPAYCRETTDDPAWGKPKTDRDGNPVMYCRITSRNAPEWVGLHSTAKAMDVDDIPF